MRRTWPLLSLVSFIILGGRAHGACSSPAEAAEKAKGTGFSLDRAPSPAMPVAWPPTGAPAVRYFDFRHEPRPTGIISYMVWSPEHERTVPLDGGAMRERTLGKPRKLGSYNAGAERRPYPTEAEAALFAAVCGQRAPTEAEAATIRAGYKAWIAEVPPVKAELERLAGTFLTWLYAGGGAK